MNEQNTTNNGMVVEVSTWTHPTVKYTQRRILDPVIGAGVLVKFELYQQFKSSDKTEPEETSMMCYSGGDLTFIPGVTIDQSVTPARLVAIKGCDLPGINEGPKDCGLVKPKIPGLDDFLKFASGTQEIRGEFRNVLKNSSPSPTYPKDPAYQATKEKLDKKMRELTRDLDFQPAIHPDLAALRREKEIMINAMTAFIARLPKGKRFALCNDPSMIIELQSNDPFCTTHIGHKGWEFRNVTKSYDVVISSDELLANYQPIPEPIISTVYQRSQYNALDNKFNDLLFSLATQFGARREGEDFTIQQSILTLELMRNEISELRRLRSQGNASILKSIFGDAPVRFGLCQVGEEIDQNIAQRTVQSLEQHINGLLEELLGLRKLTARISEDLRNCALRHRLIGNHTPDQHSLDDIVTYIINYVASLLVKLDREQKARAESDQQCRNLNENAVRLSEIMAANQTGQYADKSSK